MIFNNISRLCKEHSVSVHQVEQECGLGNGTIGGWKKSSPNLDNIKAVAEYFGCTIDELLRDPRDPEEVSKDVGQITK